MESRKRYGKALMDALEVLFLDALAEAGGEAWVYQLAQATGTDVGGSRDAGIRYGVARGVLARLDAKGFVIWHSEYQGRQELTEEGRAFLAGLE